MQGGILENISKWAARYKIVILRPQIPENQMPRHYLGGELSRKNIF